VVRNLPASRAATERLQAQVQSCDQQWSSILAHVYARIDTLKHSPGPIPATQCGFEEDHRVLAQLKPFDLRAALGGRFRAPHAAWLHLKAASKGVRSWKQALSSEIRQSQSAVARKLGV